MNLDNLPAPADPAADLTELSVPYAGKVLTSLEEEGILEPGREGRTGRGFYYIPVPARKSRTHARIAADWLADGQGVSAPARVNLAPSA